MIKNRFFALAYRLSSFIFALVGVLAQIGVFNGILRLDFLMFYTIQSNLLAVFLFILLSIRTIKALREEGICGNAGWFARFEMICVVNLLVTLIVYWALLAQTSTFNLWTFENIATHGITPLLCLLDYILFTKGRHLKYKDVYYVNIFPLCYIVFVYITTFFGYVYRMADGTTRRFPYFFLDYERFGFGVIAYIGGLFLFFLLLSNVIYLIDQKVRKI
jgi:hypothetical protein